MDVLKESWALYHPWILGFAVTAVMSYGRFNTPPTSRSSTTWGRYHLMATLYSLAFITTWIMFASTPDIVAALSNNAGQIGQFKSLETPIYAALLLIVLAGGVVPFSTFDDKVRRSLQDLARIPWEVQRLTAALRARTWLPSEEFQVEIRRALRSRGFDDADMSFSCERTPQALWTRTTALMRYINEWQTRRGKFGAYYFANIKLVAQHEEEYEQLGSQAMRVFPKVKPPATGSSKPTADDVKEELAHSFVSAAERLEKALCETVSRGILTCGLTDGARRAEFEKVGFMVNVTPSRLFDDVLALYLVLIGLFIVVLSLAKRPRPWLTAVIIATIYMGAVVMAILSKRWTWARSRNGNVPVSGCVAAAAVAFGFAALTSLGLAIVLTFNVREAWALVATRWWPWGLMSAVVAGLLAYLIELEETPNRRWVDVAMMASVCGAAAIAVVGLLAEACGNAPRCDNPPLLRVVLNSIVVGAIIGWCVPSWYRRPQIMVTEYLGFKVIISLRTNDSGVVASVDLEPPRRRATTDARVRLADDVECALPDDAIADAVRKARTWVDANRAASVPPPRSSVPVALAG